MTVANALTSFLLQCAPHGAGIAFEIIGSVLKVVLYAIPGAARRPIPNPASTHVAGLTNLLREPVRPAVNGDWLERALNLLGFKYTRTNGVSDPDLTKQIALQLQYHCINRLSVRRYC